MEEFGNANINTPYPTTMKLAPLALLTALAAASCSSGPTAKELLELDKLEVSAALGLGISSLEAIHPQLKTLVKRNIAGHAGLRQNDLWNIRYFRADLRGSKGELLPATILRLPLRDPFAAAGLYLAFDAQGRLAASGTSLGKDSSTLWNGFLGQFVGSAAAQTADLMTPGKAHLYWKELQNDPALPNIRLALYQQKRFMGENSVRMEQIMDLTGRGQLPSAAMLRDWAANWQQMQQIAPKLTTIVGQDQVSRYPDFIAEAQDILERAAVATDNGQPSAVRSLISRELGRETCRSCHTMSSGSLGGKMRPSLQNRLTEFGAPPLFRVGRDLWGPPNRTAAAQYLASTVKAGLLLAGQLQNENRL
jgi:hypothetical protein